MLLLASTAHLGYECMDGWMDGVMVATARIVVKLGSFNRIRQVALMCAPSDTIKRARTSPRQTASRSAEVFCRAHGRDQHTQRQTDRQTDRQTHKSRYDKTSVAIALLVLLAIWVKVSLLKHNTAQCCICNIYCANNIT